MVLKEFDPKLMKFLYFLATHQKKMNSTEASRELRKGGWDISDRTIRRWFKALNEKNEINYFLNLKSENFGVVRTYVLLEKINAGALSNLIPFVIYNVNGTCLGSLERVQLVQYDIPSSKIKEFNEFWKKSKRLGLIENVKIYPHSTAITLYAPFHEVVNSNGQFGLKENYKVPDYFMKLYSTIAQSETKPKLSGIISQHPIIVPMLYSSFGENFSSKNIWESLKKHSELIWNFVPKKLLRKGKHDGAAIKYVHDVMKIIEANEDELFQQIRVSYRPFYYGHHNGYYLFVKLKNNNKIERILKELHNRTLQLQYIPHVHGKEHMFYFITNEKKFLEIIHDILPKFADTRYDNKIILQNLRGIKNTYGKVDWTMFDPVKKEWVYEHEKYMKELEKLAKEVRTKQPLKEP